MKRELIGLVLGTMLLMAGLAFLFSQNITASTSLESKRANDANDIRTEQPVVAQAAMSAPPVMQDTPTPAAMPATLAVAAVRDTPAPPETATEITPAVTAALPPTAVPEEVPVAEQPAAVENTPTATPPATAAQPDTASAAVATGWIYAGQFANGKWTEQGVRSGSTLPVSGQRYALTWSATVRDNPPGKKTSGSKLGKVIANLAAGKEVEVVQVKQSGRQGHVWLEIKHPK